LTKEVTNPSNMQPHIILPQVYEHGLVEENKAC